LFSQGTYDLSGTGTLEADTEHIGYGGTGSFTQSGGLNKVISDLFVGITPPAKGVTIFQEQVHFR